MRVKNKYRQIRPEIKSADENKSPVEEITEPNIPEIKLDGEKAEPVMAASIEAEPEAVAAVEEAAKADTAALALKRQIEAIHQAEALQRQQAAQMMAAQRPLTREQKLEFWKQNGLSDDEAKFLQEFPEMIDHSAITNHAAAEALQAGHERDSEAYFAAVKEGFHRHMTNLKAQAQAAQPTPAFFRAPSQKAPPAAPSRAAIVSAPVSREVRTGGERPDFETDPRRVVLSADEAAIAAASGITAAEYARYKIKMQREKASGQRQ